MPIISIEHIELDENGVARVSGTRSRVINLALDIRNGLTADEIYRRYSHLSRAQIHAALAYYYDHQHQLDDVIDRELLEVHALEANTVSPTRDELQARISGKSLQ